MHTSTLIITNSRLHSALLQKREGQTVIQFWHGIPWKKLAYDQASIHFSAEKTEHYLQRFKADVAKWDYLWVPNHYAKMRFQSAFRYEGQYIQAMYPADKQMLAVQDDQAYFQEIKAKLGVPGDKKVILYMPTFREQLMVGSGSYSYYSNIDIVQLAMQNPACVFLTRVHYLIAQRVGGSHTNLVDVSHYNSVKDLYLISDVLITDYSSALYSFALLKKPIISLQFDMTQYVHMRGLYEDAITDMDIIEIKDRQTFMKLDLQNDLPKSKPKEDYYSAL